MIPPRQRLILGTLLLLLGLLAALVAGRLLFRSPLPDLQGHALKITDGDTFTLDTGTQRLKIRLSEIDAPEMNQPYGTHARQALAALLTGHTVQIHHAGLDRYGRTLGRVAVNGLDINAELVKQGAAWVYVQYAHDSELFALEAEARAAQRGLWALPEAQRLAPWDWRHTKKKGSEEVRIEAPSGSCDKRTCKEMVSCDEAKFYLTQCGLSRLDGDGDGIPCEKLCAKTSHKSR